MMATYLTVHDGKIEFPEEVRQAFDLKEGTRLRLVSSAGKIVLDQEQESTVPLRTDWRSLRGTLADVAIDFNAELEADRIRENELDARLG